MVREASRSASVALKARIWRAVSALTLPSPAAAGEGVLGLVLLVCLAACGGAAPGATNGGASSSGAGGQANAAPGDWDKAVAAAKGEGKVGVLTSPGDDIRQYFDAFQKEYGISVELLVGNGNADLVPKVDAERKA